MHNLNRVTAALALLLSLYPATSFSADGLSLDSAISEGLSASPTVKKAEAKALESRWSAREALGAGFLPKISFEAGHYFDTKYEFTTIVFAGSALSFPGMYPTTQLSLQGSIPIFDGFASTRHYQAAAFNNDADEADLRYTQFQVTERIRLAFFQALAAQELQSVAEQNVKTLDDHLKQINLLKRNGVATTYDTLRVEVQLSEAKSDAVDAADNVALTRRQLAQVMGTSSDDRPLIGELPTPDSSKAANIEQLTNLEDREDIHALGLRAQAADRERISRNSWFIPSINLTGQLDYYNVLLYNGQVVDNHQYSTAYNVGIFATWNLFDGGVSLSKGREAAAQAAQSAAADEEAKLQAPYDFAYWKKHFISNADHYLSKKLDVDRSQESVRLAKEEERAGTRTSTEVLDAELDLFRAKAGVVNAQVNAAEALIRLELALGRTI